MSWFKLSRKPPRVRNVIANVIYDTRKAKCLASHYADKVFTGRHIESVQRPGWDQHLYRSSAGNFFLVVKQGDSARLWIEPLTPEAAFIWLNGFQEVALLERFFADRLTHG